MPSYYFSFQQQVITPLAASGNTNAIKINPRTADFAVTFHVKFVQGSLTNATFVAQVLNPDTSTWENYSNGTTGVLTADTNFAIPVFCPGAQFVRLAYTSTGTATGSSITVDVTARA